jgi:hypothetical protein
MHPPVKAGYPPKGLTLIPELPISSLGLSKGEQLIVNQNSGGQSTRSTPARSAAAVSTTGEVPQPNSQPSGPVQPTKNEPDSIEVEGGYLVHRVRFRVAVHPCHVGSLKCMDRSYRMIIPVYFLPLPSCSSKISERLKKFGKVRGFFVR